MSRYRGTKEKGLTLISWAAVLALIGFFTLLVLKIAPIYMENYKVKSALESLKGEADLTSKSRQEILELLRRRLDINMVDDVTKDDITIIKEPNFVKVEVDYEVTSNIAGNLDVLVYFDDVIEVESH